MSYITQDDEYSLSFDPPSPTFDSFEFPHTPDYNASYNTSPYSANSDLSFVEDDSSNYLNLFGTSLSDPQLQPNTSSNTGLLMFPDVVYEPDDNLQNRSRASSASSHHLSPSPRLDVAQSFENMTFHSPAWGTEPLPPETQYQQRRSVSPHAKPQSPPRLVMPDSDSTYAATQSTAQPFVQPPTINAPDGDGEGAGPKLRIVPATPVSGGAHGDGGQGMSFARGADNLGVIDESMHSPFHNQFAQSTSPPAASTLPGTSQSPPQPQHIQRQRSPSHSSAHGSSSPGPTTYTFPAHNKDPSTSSSVSSVSGFFFPNNNANATQQPPLRHRSRSDNSLEPPNTALWGISADPQNAILANSGSAIVDDMNEIAPSDLALRRSRSDAGQGPRMGHTRQSRSEDIRGGVPNGFSNSAASTSGGLLTVPGVYPGGNGGDYLSPQDPPPSIRGHGHSLSWGGTPPSGSMGMGFATHQQQQMSVMGMQGFARGHIRRASSGSRSERGTAAGWGGDVGGEFGGGAAGSARVSPYPSPNASPRVRYDDLPPSDPLEGMGYPQPPPGSRHPSLTPQFGTVGLPPTGQSQQQQTGGGGGGGQRGVQTVTVGGSSVPLNVSKVTVTTGRTAKASHNRRKQEANFVCPVPGCGSTFTRSFNLKGHIRSHNEEKPFLCHWPGCGKGFARQHDCKRHEQLHTNYRPFVCEGCKKMFARMDALNRHLRSEGGAECMRAHPGNQSGGSQDGKSQQPTPQASPSPQPSSTPPNGGMGSRGRSLSASQHSDAMNGIPMSLDLGDLDVKPGAGGVVDVNMPYTFASQYGMAGEVQGQPTWGVGVTL